MMKTVWLTKSALTYINKKNTVGGFPLGNVREARQKEEGEERVDEEC